MENYLYGSAGSIVEKYMQEYGRLDTLGNNASKRTQYKGLAETDSGKFALPLKLEMWESMGLVDTTSSTFDPNTLPMLARGDPSPTKNGSRIINTSPVVAFRGTPLTIDCAVTKGLP